MGDIIQLLPDHVANQIAAGEVVQRPASVVKELLENAIDAGATQISLVLKDAGKTLIQVSDNGKGMSATDARLSFERHATSKIKRAEDLFQLTTKGFRGEALASIAAIAQVELKSKQEQDELGTCIKIKGSEVESQEPCVTQKGTIIGVKNLFFNIPARRNFLKSNQVETRHVIDEFQRVAIAHAQIGFSLHHNGNELFNLPATNARQRIVHIFGSKTNEKLVPVSEETELINIEGFVGKPAYAKRTRSEQFFFVNNRFIKSPYLHHAVNAAFEGLLPDKAQPSYFLFLSIDPKRIDINIHPTKTEIKFDDEHALYAILRSAIKHSLGQFNVAPILDFERDSSLDTPYDLSKKEVQVPQIEVDRNFNPFDTEKQAASQSAAKAMAFNRHTAKKNVAWEALYTQIDDQLPETKIEVESEEVTGNLFGQQQQDLSGDSVFQLQKKYIVCPFKNGMLLLDQNRAHTRILYEELLRNITVKAAVSQQLLFPLSLQYNAIEVDMLSNLREHLEQIGFIFDSIDTSEVSISGIPTLINESEVSILLDQLLADFEHEIPDSGFLQTDVFAKSMARSMAVKNGSVLAKEEQLAIINSLFACKEPQICPNNKKVFVRLEVEDLEKNFR